VALNIHFFSEGAHVELKDFGIKIKGLDSAGLGSFEGVLAAYNNVDLGGDLIEPGSFTRTINSAKTIPLLWQHKTDQPIGTLTLIDGPDALRVKGQLLLELPTAKDAHALLKAGVIKGLSIGYDTIKDSIEDGVRHLKELRLWEGSIVTFPMNELATVTGVKSLSDEDKAKHLTAIREHSKSIDHHQRAIRMHLKSMMDGLDDDEADDLALIDDDDEGEGKAFLLELRELAAQAEELATL
jgi:HK97 family phage prohead protease